MTGNKYRSSFGAIIFLIVLVILSACSSAPAASEDPTVTPTPTIVMQVVLPTSTEIPSKCAGLAGELEVQVLVGPAEIVGLEPHAVGNIPFAVTTGETPYLIQGGGGIDYSDLLAEEWGTYEVTMNLDLTVTGDCDADENGGGLVMVVEMTGNQLVVVIADGFHGEYPWEGTHTIDLDFPLEEGASFAGDGYAFILHLK